MYPTCHLRDNLLITKWKSQVFNELYVFLPAKEVSNSAGLSSVYIYKSSLVHVFGIFRLYKTSTLSTCFAVSFRRPLPCVRSPATTKVSEWKQR